MDVLNYNFAVTNSLQVRSRILIKYKMPPHHSYGKRILFNYKIEQIDLFNLKFKILAKAIWQLVTAMNTLIVIIIIINCR